MLFAAAVAAAACTGGGGDDDDDAASPSPTPPFVADGCQIVWSSPVATGPTGVVDVYLFDAPISAWTVGTHGYGAPATGRFFRAYDLDTGTFDYVALATSGSYTMTAAGTTAGTFVRFVDETPQPFYVLGTAGAPVALAGTSGTGTFDGFLSDPYAANVSPGQGEMSIMVGTTSFSVGGNLSYAICYEGAAPLKPVSR